ncbi:hypothetical protein L5515_015173 [Caenorhabditis briggsae]|uniref:Phosphate transporter n=1 Tax=Caenorhabditis briggsae TaxID=6238 RepID=A0AAE9EI31_CAEBR|nr:hypothetical protein L5515_015173 [Caenorhabditis briggsae]
MNFNSHLVLNPPIFVQVTTPAQLPLIPEAYKPFPHYNLEVVQWSLLFGVCFMLGVGMGANDVADAFGTSVGTGTVTVTQAFILATIVEMMGSVASGFSGDGKALKIIHTSSYADNPDELVIGQIAMLVGCATWLMVATYYSMPKNPVNTGLFLLPGIYVIVVFTNVFLFLQDGSRVLRFDEIPFMYTVAISLVISVLAGFLALFVVGPVMKRRLKKKTEELPRIASSLSYTFEPTGCLRKAVYWAFPPMRNDDQKAVRLFSFLQILTACFAGFAHGANDITNCVAPIRELVQMYNQGYREDNTDLNISVYVGLLTTLAVLMGIWTLGIRIIRTVGENFAKMNPATGFSVEFGAAICALATNTYNIPQSMTHCLVGSIFGLGLVRSGPILKWHTVKYVFLSWILTIPVSGLISAAVMYLLQAILSF